MKKTTLLTITAMAVAFGLNACTDAEMASVEKGMKDAQHQSQDGPKGSVYSPQQGILCDSQAGFCTDSSGISLAFTKDYLGQQNEDIWSKRMDSDFDITRFGFSNSVYCDTNVRKCWTNKYKGSVDYYYTGKLF